MLSARWPKAVATIVAVLALSGVAWAAGSQLGVIGPSNGIQPTGRKLDPVGKMTQLGNFPTGGALTKNGRFLWTLSTGRARNDIRIVRVNARSRRKVGQVVQTIQMPGLSGGIAMSPDGHTAYVSGVPDSPHKDQQAPPGTPGTGGDVIHVFTYDRKTGIAQRGGVIPVPPPTGTLPYQDFPPGSATKSWPRDVAVSPDGKTLLVALNLADSAAIINTATHAVRYVSVGHYPYGAAITRNGRYGLVTGETEGTVSVINLATASVTKTIQVGPHLSHPEGMAVDPKAPLVFVANASQDVIAAINTDTMTVQRTLSVGRPQGQGTTPTYVSVTPDGCDLLSADSGEDAVAVFALSDTARCDRPRHGRQGSRPARHPFELIGRLPVGSYPTMAAANRRGKLVWISARGLGVGPNPNGPNPESPNDSDDFINSFQYLPSIVRGSSGILRFPSDPAIRKLTPQVDRQIVPTNSQAPPAGTPIRAGGPIKHVFYVVRENRTYDQVLGDDPRGDGDPNLTLFGQHVTPNLHALAQRFPLLDHVYADSEASIDGHYWTAAGAVSDYVVKNWPQNYAGRGRPYDFGAYEVSAPPEGLHLPARSPGQRLLLQLRRGPGRTLAAARQRSDPRGDDRERAGPQPDPLRHPARRWLLRLRRLDFPDAGDRPEAWRRLRLIASVRRQAHRPLPLRLLQDPLPNPAADQLGAVLQLPLPATGPHPGGPAGGPHSRRGRRLQ